MDPSHAAPPTAGPHPLGASLRRSSTERMLLGLCGGVARALDVHPTAVRVATLLLGITLLPATVLAYLVTAVILPADDGSVLIGRGERHRRDVTAALLLSFIGAPLVIGAGAAWGLTSGPLVWPLMLLGAGAAIGVAVYRPGGLGQARSATAGGAAAAAGWAPPSRPFDAPAPAADQAVDPGEAPTSVGAAHPAAADVNAPPAEADLAGPIGHGDVTKVQSTATEAPTFVKPVAGGPGGPGGPPTFVKPGDGPGGGEPSVPEPPQRGLAVPVISVLALIPAVFALLFAAGAIDGGWSTWAVMLAVLALASAAGAVAIALLRPSYLGAALLVILAALMGTASIGLSQAGPLLDDGVGERVYRPQSVAEIPPVFVHGMGALDVDLRDLELRRGSRTIVRAQLGFGEVTVAVPRGARVVAAPDSPLTGLTTSARRNGAAAATSASAPTIVLDVALRGGDVRLVSGSSSNLDSLEVLAQQATGFWDPGEGDRFDRFRDRPLAPVTPATPREPVTPREPATP